MIDTMAKNTNSRHSVRSLLIIVFILIIGYVIWALYIATPSIKPNTSLKTISYVAPSVSLPWPPYGQAAIGIDNQGVIASHGTETPSPTASTAKLITALCVLKKHPITPGQSGPIITISPADVAIYNKYQSEDGSDMVVVNGEQLTEYQMLEAMMLPSADNIADSLAIWSFGSLTNYSAYANNFLKTHGLNSTHVGNDASGYDPSTTSTASNLVKIGELVMDSPILSGIVSKPSVSGMPIVGTIRNYNMLLGKDNIVGIKTGNTNQAGGVYISASKLMVNNSSVTIVTAIMQAPTLLDAMSSSLPLIKAAQSNFTTPPEVASISQGTLVGEYRMPWQNSSVSSTASQPGVFSAWGSTNVTESIKLNDINVKSKLNQVIGTITISSVIPKDSKTIKVVLSSVPSKPSKLWVLLHPEYLVHL